MINTIEIISNVQMALGKATFSVWLGEEFKIHLQNVNGPATQTEAVLSEAHPSCSPNGSECYIDERCSSIWEMTQCDDPESIPS